MQEGRPFCLLDARKAATGMGGKGGGRDILSVYIVRTRYQSSLHMGHCSNRGPEGLMRVM